MFLLSSLAVLLLQFTPTSTLTLNITMSAFDLWDHQFCLACDKQVHTEAAYCSEACRLADYEKTSTPSSSQASSPGFPPPSFASWSMATPEPSTRPPTKFYLSPAYDFSEAQPYGATPPRKSSFLHQYVPTGARQSSIHATDRNLSPSSSHSSLCSMCSTSTNGDAGLLSDKARKELRAYAVSFEQVRLQRRRSY